MVNNPRHNSRYNSSMNNDQKFEDFSIGDYTTFDKIWDLTIFEKFRSISGDNNPLHHDKVYASKTSFGQPIVPLHLAISPLSAIAGMMIPGNKSLYLTNRVRAIEAVPYDKKITYSAKIVALNESNQVIDLRVLLLDKGKLLVEAEMVVQVREDVNTDWVSNYSEYHKVSTVPRPTVLVVGALGGIGQSVCYALAKKGISILLHYRLGRKKDALALAENLRKFGTRIEIIAADLEEQKSIELMVRQILKKETITALVHLASPSVHDSMKKNMAINYQSLVTLLDALTPRWLTQQTGRVVYVGSSAVEYFPEGWENYIAAKLAASRYLLAWHGKYSKYDIEGRVVSPGYVKTSFSDSLRKEGAGVLLPEQVSELILKVLLEDSGSEQPYLWLEASGLRRGKWGFFTQQSSKTSKSSVGSVNSPSVAVSDPLPNCNEPIEDLVREFFGLENQYDLSDSGVNLLPEWDSLKHIELMLFLEKKLGIHFKSEEIENTKMFLDLKKIVTKNNAL